MLTKNILHHWIFSRQFTHANIENIDKRMTDDIDNISTELSYLLHNGTNCVIQLCVFVPKFVLEIQKGGGTIIKIAFFGIAFALIMSLTNLLFKKYINRYHKQQLETSGVLRRSIKGTDQMSSSIAMLNGKDATMMYLEQKLENDINAQQKIFYLNTFYNFIQSLINKINGSLGAFLFLPLAGMGIVTTFDSAYAASLVWYILYALVFFPQNTGKITEITVSLNRLQEIYTTCADTSYTGLALLQNDQNKDQISHDTHPALINATIFIQKKHVLHMLLQNVDMRIAPREHILLYGKSGTGKTTLLHALHGHYTYASGTITLPSHAELFFLPHKTLIIEGDIFDNIAYPSNTYDKAKIEHILLQILPLYKTLDMQNLSAGERQKIQIARLLYLSEKNYYAIFMDEPLSNIDQHESQMIMKMIYNTFPNSAIIISMHDGKEILGDIFDTCINLEKYSLRE